MNTKIILIIWGDPDSIFSEILIKSLKRYKNKKPIVLIGSYKLLIDQIHLLNLTFNTNKINIIKKDFSNIKKNKINLINVDYKYQDPFEKSVDKKKFISRCFKIAFFLIRKFKIKALINGPINKKDFLQKKYIGITEYIASEFNIKKIGMLIYNKKLSVCPVTTHLPLKLVSSKISKLLILEKIIILNKFFRDFLKKKPKIAIAGLNPHNESFLEFNEDKKIVFEAIKMANKKKFLIKGPFPADTIFLKSLRNQFDVIIGMYHDQVLTPFKTLFEYDGINITMGLPFIRVSPDHGPNINMVGKNISNPTSLIRALEFLDKR